MVGDVAKLPPPDEVGAGQEVSDRAISGRPAKVELLVPGPPALIDDRNKDELGAT